jgi:hypothetical protein
VAVRTQSSANLVGLFDTHFKARSGSPIVASSTRRSRVRNECRVDICYGLPTATFTSHATVE